MTDRLALVEPSTADSERPRLALNGTGSPAGGTGLLGTQGLGLLFEAGLQGSFGQAGGRGLGDLFHGVEIDVEARAGVAKRTAGDDFSPLGGEGAQFLEFLRSELASRHDASCVGVTGQRVIGLLLPDYAS